jgi:hypothetical protein
VRLLVLHYCRVELTLVFHEVFGSSQYVFPQDLELTTSRFQRTFTSGAVFATKTYAVIVPEGCASLRRRDAWRNPTSYIFIQRKSIHSIAHLSRNSGRRHRHPHATPSPSHREFRFTFPPHPEGDELKRESKDGLHPQIRSVLSEIKCGIGSTDPTI